MTAVDFSFEPVGWSGHKCRFAFANGEVRTHFTVDPFDAQARERCVKNIRKAAPGLDDDATQQLERAFDQWAIDKSADDAGDDGDAKRPKASRAVELAREACSELFHDADDNAYADLMIDGVRWTMPIESTAFRREIDRLFYESEGNALGSQPRADALAVLTAVATHDGIQREVFIRTAKLGDRVFIDLGDDSGRVVDVDKNGWRVVDAPKDVRFRREKGSRPMPRPVPDGDVVELRGFMQASADWERDERDWVLTVAWLLASLSGLHPYPIAVLQGEQGTGKSTRSKLMRELVDPNGAPLRGQPREERDLVIAARNSSLLAYDNLSHVPEWLSDALCRLATGSGFATRTLYTNTEETIFQTARPILLNGIPDLVARPDLAGRAIVFRLPTIDKVEPESDYWSRFEVAQPRIFGALLDGLVMALHRGESHKLEDPPRMADFANLVNAASPAFGWDDTTFIHHYREAMDQLVRDELAVEPVAVALDDLISSPFKVTQEHQGFQLEDGALTARAGDWLTALASKVKPAATHVRSWPKDARALSNKLSRLTPSLRSVGIDVARTRRRDARLITITKRGPDE